MRRNLAGSVIVAAVVLTAAASAQSCPVDWTPGLFAAGGIDGTVYAFATFDDDGPGPNPPCLIVAGSFAEAGGRPANNIARWDGREWWPLGSGTNAAIRALAVFDDDGVGPNPARLIAGGIFWLADNAPAWFIASWDGTAWSALGGGVTQPGFPPPAVDDLLVFDEDGSGPGLPALFVAGKFSSAGNVAANGLARWNGTSWSAVGPLPGGLPPGVGVTAVVSFDDDGLPSTPPRLAAAGFVQGAYPVAVATWNGVTWTILGDTFNNTIGALEVFDPDGSGPAPEILVAGGSFGWVGSVAANHIAAWAGGGWSPLGTGVSGVILSTYVNALTAFDDDGPGPNPPALIAGGSFATAGLGGAANIAKWNGSSWSALGAGVVMLDPLGGGAFPGVMTFGRLDPDGAGPLSERLLVGGLFTKAGSIGAKGVALWDGAAWSKLGSSVDGVVRSLIEIDPDGPGPVPPVLAAGGHFAIQTPAGVADNVAFWNGSAWARAGPGPGTPVFAMLLHDLDGNPATPPDLIAGGDGGVFAWNGTAWSAVGGAIGIRVRALAVFDEDGPGPLPPRLFAGGRPVPVPGCPEIRRLTPFGWTTVGMPGALGPCNQWNLTPSIDALAVYDEDDAGPALPVLFAAGSFSTPGVNVAKWNGATWQPVGGGVGGATTDFAKALAVFDPDGSGALLPRLFCAGRFATPFNDVAAWDGAAWSDVSGGLTLPPPPASPVLPYQGSVEALAVVDLDGPGPQPPGLAAGGSFASNGATTIRNVGFWNGASWSGFGAGVAGGPGDPGGLTALAWGRVSALIAFDVDAGGPMPPALFAGGDFAMAGSFGSQGIARFGLQPSLAISLAPDLLGNLSVAHSCCVAGAHYVTVFSLDALNQIAPGLGPVGGLHVTLADALGQVQTGLPPFVGALDAVGSAQFLAPAAWVAPLTGLTLYAVSILWAQPGLAFWETASPIASVSL